MRLSDITNEVKLGKKMKRDDKKPASQIDGSDQVNQEDEDNMDKLADAADSSYTGLGFGNH